VTSVQFAYWLQGLFELGKPEALDKEQTALIKNHLAMVFKHEIDPSAGSASHQADLNALHNPVATEDRVTPENLEQAVKDVIAKLPKAPPSSYGPGPVLRC
jgi:hypothetical protein